MQLPGCLVPELPPTVFVQSLAPLGGCGSLVEKSQSTFVLFVGVGLYPQGALINHSGTPNAMQTFQGQEICFQALQPIEKGTEVTISYIELAATRAERRKEVLEQYYFDIDEDLVCTCPFFIWPCKSYIVHDENLVCNWQTLLPCNSDYAVCGLLNTRIWTACTAAGPFSSMCIHQKNTQVHLATPAWAGLLHLHLLVSLAAILTARQTDIGHTVPLQSRCREPSRSLKPSCSAEMAW